MNERDRQGGSEGRPASDEPLSIDEALERFATVVAQAATEKIESQIPALVARLESHGIDVIVLKGPVTRRRLYADDERRPVADIDLLVDPAAFRRAARVLGDAGYRRYDRHGHSDAFSRGPDDADVDLHLTLPYVTVSPRRAFAVFAAHRTTLDVAGSAVPALDRPAHVVHLAIHAAVNRFEDAQRSSTEWERGLASLGDDEIARAEAIAGSLGVGRIWDLARRALADGADRDALLAQRPTWEAVPRVWSMRGFITSGTPLRVKWRDVQRLVALQWADSTVNEWRAKRGAAPLATGSLRIAVEKLRRFVTVSTLGLARIAGIGRVDHPDTGATQ